MRLMECNMRAICLEIYNSWMLTLVEYFKTIKTSSKAHVFYKKQEKFPTGKHNSINQLNHSSYCSPNSFSLPHHKRYFIVIIPKLHTLSIERGNHRKKNCSFHHPSNPVTIFSYFQSFFISADFFVRSWRKIITYCRDETASGWAQTNLRELE